MINKLFDTVGCQSPILALTQDEFNVNQLKPKTPMTYDDKNDSGDHDGNDADDKD